jgi:diphosphomevalonate decarboxylase
VRAVARAHSNIALVKYWGKRDARLNLPAAGSLSLTLDGLSSTTEVVFGASAEDELWLDSRPAAEAALRKALRVVDEVRRRAGLAAPACIRSKNDFPTGAGLASSASGLAALAVAAARAAGLHLAPAELSALARLGSGSACRSLFGGFVEWCAGERTDGSDSHGVPLFPPEHWDLRCCAAIVSDAPKPVGSTEGMQRTAASSPLYADFVQSVPADLEDARAAIAARDLGALGRVAERSCLNLHEAMQAADPPLVYLRPESLAVIDAVRTLRERDGMPVFFTADAGPNVKVFGEPAAMPVLQTRLRALRGVQRLLLARPGGAAELLEGD